MGINVASSFTRNAAVPIDDALVVADLTARDAIDSGVRYEGMFVYVVSEALNYQLVGGITNSDWADFAASGGSGDPFNLLTESDTNFDKDLGNWVQYTDVLKDTPVRTGNTIGVAQVSTVPWKDNDPIYYNTAIGTTAIGGLTAGTVYYVINTSTGFFSLSTTPGGTAITLSGTPSGDHYFFPIYPVTGDGSKTYDPDTQSDFGTYNTTNPLRGVGDMLLTSPSGGSFLGKGMSVDFDVPIADRGKPMSINLETLASSGYFGSSAQVISGVYPLSVWFYDVTNSVRYMLPVWNISSSGEFTSQFQMPATCAQGRLILHTSGKDGGGWTNQIDDVSIKKNIPVFIPADSDMELVTVTGSWTTNTTYTALRGKEGQFAYYDITIKTSGAPTAAALTLTLPDTIDISKMRPTSLADNLTPIDGTGAITDASTNNYRAVIRIDTSSSTTNVVKIGQVTAPGANNYITTDTNATTPFTFGNGDSINVKFRVPILGWTSGVSTIGQMYQNVPVRFGAYKNGGSVTATTTIPTWTAIEADSHGGFNISSGVYTIKAPGDFDIAFRVRITSASAAYARIYLNGSAVKTGASVTSSESHEISATLYNLKVGDTIDFRLNGNATLQSDNTSNYISINRRNDPSAFLTINRSTTKYLASTLSADTTDIASLKYNGTLIVGKKYRIELKALASSGGELRAIHNGSSIVRASNDATAYSSVYNSVEFIASATSLTFNFIRNSNGSIIGSGTAIGTSVTLTELNNTTEGNF